MIAIRGLKKKYGATVDDMLANGARAVQEKLLVCRNRLMRMEQRLMAREPLIHARQMRLRTEHLQ